MLKGLVGVCFIILFSQLLVKSSEQKYREPNQKDIITPNVRTVLFKKSDKYKACWTRDEIALLFSRRVMQDLLPKKQPESVSLLMEYLRECVDVVNTISSSRRGTSLLMLALSDTLGGYLKAFGLPMAYESFYEGTLGYNSTKQLHDQMEYFERVLRTDGSSWTRPIKVEPSPNITPLRLTAPIEGHDACAMLITQEQGMDNGEDKKIRILLPFFDNNDYPSVIVLPFKDKNIYNLESNESLNILVKYYTRSLWCLTQTYGYALVADSDITNIPQVERFVTKFRSWLNDFVVPHLQSSHFYPAFGSVLRMIEPSGSKQIDTRMIKREQDAFNDDDNDDTTPDSSSHTPSRFYIMVISSLVIAFWIIVLTVYIVYRCVIRKKECRDNTDNFSTSSSVTCSYGMTPRKESSYYRVKSEDEDDGGDEYTDH